jgi:hypothetical protein
MVAELAIASRVVQAFRFVGHREATGVPSALDSRAIQYASPEDHPRPRRRIWPWRLFSGHLLHSDRASLSSITNVSRGGFAMTPSICGTRRQRYHTRALAPARRELLETRVLPKLREPIRSSRVLDAPLADLIASVKAQGLEGSVAKRIDSRYESGERSGTWQKFRVNQGQELVIGGYTPSAKNFDALVIGYDSRTENSSARRACATAHARSCSRNPSR